MCRCCSLLSVVVVGVIVIVIVRVVGVCLCNFQAILRLVNSRSKLDERYGYQPEALEIYLCDVVVWCCFGLW